MPKGYWVACVDVTDPEGYNLYMAEVINAFRKYGGRYLMRGGKSERLEGEGRSRIVVIEFKDYATVLACPPLAGIRQGTCAPCRQGSR